MNTNDYDELGDIPPKIERAKFCEMCGYPLTTQFNPNDTSTWREDNFCSARCKRNKNSQLWKNNKLKS